MLHGCVHGGCDAHRLHLPRGECSVNNLDVNQPVLSDKLCKLVFFVYLPNVKMHHYYCVLWT